MARMKTFFIYLILFIAFYLLVDILVYFSTKDNYKDLTNYEVTISSPEIKITECKASYAKGHISGTATNNTGELIDNIILKFDFYNGNGSYLGTEYHEIKYFNVNEKSKFTVNFGFEKVESVKISVNDNIVQNRLISNFIENITTDEILKFALPIGIIMGILPFIP